MSEDEQVMLRLVGYMMDNPGLLVAIFAVVVLAVLTLVGGYILFFVVFPFMAGRAARRSLYRASTATDAQGHRAELTASAKVMGSDIGLLASRGMATKARQTLGTTVMRTTWGLRLSCVLLACVALMYVFFGAEVIGPVSDMILRPALMGLAVLGLAHVFSYELRYDREVLISQSLIQFRREMPWRALVEIREESNGTYRLSFADGKRIRVQKYLVGMRDFLTRAHETIDGQGALA